MSKVSEIRPLLVSVASQLNSINPAIGNESTNVDLTIANLNRSVNLSGTIPRIRILDTALSVMCFTSSQVFNYTIEYLLKTVVAVLSSSIKYLSPIILYAVVRVAVQASRVHYLFKLPPMLDLRSVDGRHCALLKQLHCQKEFYIENGKIPLRLLS